MNRQHAIGIANAAAVTGVIAGMAYVLWMVDSALLAGALPFLVMLWIGGLVFLNVRMPRMKTQAIAQRRRAEQHLQIIRSIETIRGEFVENEMVTLPRELATNELHELQVSIQEIALLLADTPAETKWNMPASSRGIVVNKQPRQALSWEAA